MSWNRFKVLVTGGAGFIGSHLVDELINKGYSVRVLDNLSNGKIANLAHHKKNKNFEFARGSILNASLVAKMMIDIDLVFHLACLGVRHSINHPFENHKVNAEGSLIVLEKAYRAKVKKFLYCSSSEVYGTAEEVPMPESHPTFPHTVYGAGKLVGEAYTRAYFKTYGLKTVVVRLFNTFGPRSHYEGDSGEIIPKAIVRALSDQPILVFGDGKQTRDFTFVTDSARGLIEAASNPKMIAGTFNIGSNFEISINELSKKILKMVPGTRSKIKYVASRPGDVLRLYADPRNFRKLTDWKPEVSFEDGLRQTVQWFASKDISKLRSLEKGRNW